MAVDSCILATVLAIRLSEAAAWEGSLPGRLARAVACVEVMQLCWQALFFLRTDTYAVFITATRCSNLWEVQRLLLRRAFGLGRPADVARLAAADRRDVAVGTWFRWAYLVGGIAAVGGYTAFILPTAVSLVGRLSRDLATGPLEPGFWRAAATLVLVFLPLLLSAAIALLQAVRARTAAGGGVIEPLPAVIDGDEPVGVLGVRPGAAGGRTLPGRAEQEDVDPRRVQGH